jgi:hypothetical protein
MRSFVLHLGPSSMGLRPWALGLGPRALGLELERETGIEPATSSLGMVGSAKITAKTLSKSRILGTFAQPDV